MATTLRRDIGRPALCAPGRPLPWWHAPSTSDPPCRSLTARPPVSRPAPRTYTLLGADGAPCRSTAPGTLGGHRRTRVYGRMDRPAALRAIARGGHAAHRVFFADEATAIAAGYRPCASCLPQEHRAWKQRRDA